MYGRYAITTAPEAVRQWFSTRRAGSQLRGEIQRGTGPGAAGRAATPQDRGARPRTATLGSDPPLVQRPQHRLEDRQCASRDGEDRPFIQGCVKITPLPRPGGRLLRVEGHRNDQAAVRHRPAGSAALRVCRAVEELEGPVERSMGADLHHSRVELPCDCAMES